MNIVRSLAVEIAPWRRCYMGRDDHPQLHRWSRDGRVVGYREFRRKRYVDINIELVPDGPDRDQAQKVTLRDHARSYVI